MDFIFHRRIQKDIRLALVFYDEEGGPKLGDRFFAEAEQARSADGVRPYLGGCLPSGKPLA